MSLSSIDTAVAGAVLQRRFGGDASDVVEIGRGEWAAAFGFFLEGQELVIRIGAQCEDFAKDAIAATYAGAELPIPRILEIGEEPEGYYAISERAHGTHLDALDEANFRAALPGIFRVHDAMRLADVSSTSGCGAWGADGHAPFATWEDALLAHTADDPASRVHGWRERLAAYPAAQAAWDEGAACVRSLAPRCPPHRYLVHSDPLNRNILVADGRVSAVLDWGCGMYGDFLYDLAHLTFSTCWFTAWAGVDIAGEAERHYDAIALHVPAMRERLRCYEAHIGMDALAYNAFRGRPPEMLDLLAKRTLDAARGGRS